MKTPEEIRSASPSTRKEERRKKNGKSKEIVNPQNAKDKKARGNILLSPRCVNHS